MPPLRGGRPREYRSFGGDELAWQSYQVNWLAVFQPEAVLPPVNDRRRSTLWKAASRQHAAVEAARANTVVADANGSALAPGASAHLRQRLHVEPAWVQRAAPRVRGLQSGTPVVTPTERRHAVRPLNARIAAGAGQLAAVTDSVTYSLGQAGETASAAAARARRNRRREEASIRRLQDIAERAAARAAAQVQENFRIVSERLYTEAAEADERLRTLARERHLNRECTAECVYCRDWVEGCRDWVEPIVRTPARGAAGALVVPGKARWASGAGWGALTGLLGMQGCRAVGRVAAVADRSFHWDLCGWEIPRECAVDA